MSDDDIDLGPIDYLVVEFPAGRHPPVKRFRFSLTWSIEA